MHTVTLLHACNRVPNDWTPDAEANDNVEELLSAVRHGNEDMSEPLGKDGQVRDFVSGDS
eukprot:782299-Pelagomonas_calceolata.AAC.1